MKNNIVKLSIAMWFFALVVTAGCASVKTHSRPSNADALQKISGWLGTYNGTVVYTYGDITDRKGNEGFPATLVLREIPGEILFDLTTHHNKTVWLFFLPPSMFTSKSIEFIRNAPFKGTEFQFRIAITLADERLTGTMKMFSRLQDGTLKRRGAYFLSFTKQAP